MCHPRRSVEPSAPGPGVVEGTEILVAIPALNEADHIERCIRSLMTGDPRLGGVRMVVADGGSRDDTRRIVARLRGEYPNLRLVANPARVQAAAVNRVAREAGRGRFRYLVRCDAHAQYPPGFVIRVVETLVRTGAQSVVVSLDAVGEGCFQRANAWVVDTPLGSGGAPHRGGHRSGFVDHGHHAAFDLETFLALGGYDETFSHNEDAEYDRRLTAAGGRIYLDAQCRVQYAPRATPMALARQYFHYGRGRARTLAKHGGPWRLRQVLPLVHGLVLPTAVAGGFALPALWLYPATYATALAGASVWFAVRRRSVCGLWAGVAAALMHQAWALGFLSGWPRSTPFQRPRERG